MNFDIVISNTLIIIAHVKLYTTIYTKHNFAEPGNVGLLPSGAIKVIGSIDWVCQGGAFNTKHNFTIFY